jgi:Baseplate J-like protein
MPLVEPKIDDRSYEQLLNEARARIPVHNPEWTNFNDSDPGITLLQLFAFMTESLLYRSNLIPQRNRIKFLRLLGVPLQPAEPAQGLVTFSNPRGPIQPVTLASGVEVRAGQVPFYTLNGLDVLPIEARVYYKSPLSAARKAAAQALYTQLYESFQAPGVQFDFYETKPLEPPASGAVFPVVDLTPDKDTLDGALWLALLARSDKVVAQTREALANRVLTLGVLPALSDADRVLLPGGLAPTEGQPQLIYEVPNLPSSGMLPSQPEQRVARYRALDALPSGNLLAAPGVVQLPLPGSEALRLWENLEPLEQGVGDFPPSLEDTTIRDRVVTWIRIRLPGESLQSGGLSQLRARLSWIGVNAARVTQRARVLSENLGLGTGEPDQTVTLANIPVIRDGVRLTVQDALWQPIDDLMNADPEVPVHSPRLQPAASLSPQSRERKVNVYTIDRESGEIRFGDGAHGARPPNGAVIRASYDYGGGRQGNVGIGAINKSPELPAGVKVTNPVPTWGGDEEESVAQAERRIPGYLRHRDRLVATEDFLDITWRTPGVDLGRVEVLPLFHPDMPDVPAEGVVTILVIPRYDPVQRDAPRPDRLFLETVCQHLNPRRLVTTELHVRGPQYVPVWVSVGLDVLPGQDVAAVRENVKQQLRAFLSPLEGGFEAKGWPLGKAVERLELWTVATRVDGVSKVNEILLAGETGSATDRIPLTGLQLPRLAGLAVQPGTPQELAELRGDAGALPPVEPPSRVVPVPVVPPECE